MNVVTRFMRAWRTAGKRNVEGGEINRLLADWIRSGLSADKAIEKDLSQTVSRARDLQINNPYIQQYLTLLKNNVLGPNGIRMQAQVRNNDGRLAKPINDKIEAGWRDWAKLITPAGQSLADFEELLLETIAIDGEAFVIEHLTTGRQYNRQNYALELIDSDQVDRTLNLAPTAGSNEIRMGVELDEHHKPVAYHMWPRHPSEVGTMHKERRLRVPAARVIHLFRPMRAGQTRGLPWLTAAMTSLRMVHGYEEAELVAARTAAAKMGWITLDGESTPDDLQSGGSIPMEANPGQIGILPQGGTFTSWDPTHPTTAFPAFIKQALRKIASGLRVFYNALANDMEGVNYSSMRAGVQIERDTWRMLQAWLIRNWRDRIYPPMLEQSILSGEIVLDQRSPDKFLAVKWTPRGFDWVDPEKDVDTAIKEISNGLNSRTRLLAGKGEDFEEILEQLAEEQRLLAESGVSLVGETVVGKAPASRAGESQKDPADGADDEPQKTTPDDGADDRMTAGIDRIVGAIRAQKQELHINMDKFSPEIRVEAPVVHIEQPKVDVRVDAPIVNMAPLLAATLSLPARERVITERDARGLPSKVVERDVEAA